MSHLEAFHKGNDYMKEGNGKIKDKSAELGKKDNSQVRDYFKHKNYLTEMRIKRDEKEK